MKTAALIVLITLSSCRSVGEVKVHDKTRIHKEGKQMTDKQKAVLAISVFIIIGAVSNAF